MQAAFHPSASIVSLLHYITEWRELLKESALVRLIQKSDILIHSDDKLAKAASIFAFKWGMPADQPLCSGVELQVLGSRSERQPH